ncbi:RcnB family protein [Burkholderia ubonensis]|uniref:RcnB family protein n=1 Tax=Burkholderia ubonensis TaxID=101571 RepID=UPI0009B39B9A|nr:RcnB family protein [Burkholderia ubonensis]
MKIRVIAFAIEMSLLGLSVPGFAQGLPGPGVAAVGRSFPVPHSDWRRGGLVPPDYRGPQYIVDDWQAYNLQPPPPGFYWLEVNGDFVLATLATGVIANILLAPPR